MVKLTEDMVVARSRGSDIHNVKKLNCWGSELSDVSVVRKLPNVEVLSLSVNRISTLADFQYCQNLQELYIRKNNITDINEVLYLRALPKLKSLWLADNPCAEFEQYRLTVLRALPHLQKLDNVAVDSEEVQKAMVCGIPLPADRGGEEREMPRSSSVGESLRSESGGGSSLSDSSPPSSERRYSQTTTPTRPSQQNVYDDDDEQPVTRRQQGYHYAASDPERRISQHSNHGSSPQAPSGYQSANTNGHYYREADSRERQHQESYYQPQSPSRRNSQMVAEDSHGDTRGYITSPESSCTHNADYEFDSRNANYLSREDTAPRYTSGTNNFPPTPDNSDNNATNNNPQCPLHRRYSQEPRDHRWCEVEERERAYSRGDGYGYASPPSEVQQPSPAAYEQRSVSQEPRYVRQGENRAVQQNYDNAYRQAEQHMDSATRSVTSERSSPTKPYPARPKTRNANLLSAVLCLVKELDYTSLEVVEMAVRCRMEELDD
ncbi:uncharacterized protein LOC123506544 isoform X6 [Portunus trituberculatus]|uniref:uncharacterized protein LOC123506544 isoform X6 n=1 Tax=Portunus trituberculatus TaxID=210409 RepID=UPI001E1CBFAB|nr:uncharacterized protein LOC123506544 isoform X6 [Portunus trituberculatus]